MPTVSLPLTNITQSVFRPIIIGVVSKIKEATKIPKEVPDFFLNEDGYFPTAGSSLDNQTDSLARFDGKRRVVITADETFADEQQVTDVTGRQGNVPVFVDRPIGMWMAPAYVTSTVTIQLEYITRSKEEARKWRDDVISKYLQGRYLLEHQLIYSFGLPYPAWSLIEEVWKKREAIAPYGDTLEQYIRKCMTNRLTMVSSETGVNRELTVCESQDRVQGFFGFTNEPEKIQHDQKNGTYSSVFEYKFTYQRPATLDMHYPIQVHQQPLANKYIGFVNQPDSADDRVAHRSQFLWGMKEFEIGQLQRIMKPRYPYMRLPMQDQFPMNYTFPGTGAYMLALLQSPNGEKHAFNLKELGDFTMDADVLDFLKAGEYKHIGIPGKSIFHFDLYRDDQILSLPSVSLDSNLDLTILKEIDLRSQYRVRAALFTDLGFIDRAALDRLMKHPKAFQKVFGAINELLLYDSSFQQLGDQKQIFPWQLTKLYEAIMGQGTCNIYTGPTRWYGAGAWGQGWVTNNRSFLSDIPQSVLNTYRTLRRSPADVQLLGIVSYSKDRDMQIAKQMQIA